MGTPPVGDDCDCLFRRQGDQWSIVYAGSGCRMPDAKGIRYLAKLLAQPGTSIPVAELATPGRSPEIDPTGNAEIARNGGAERAGETEPLAADRGSRERVRIAVSRCIKSALARIAVAHPELGRHLEVTIRCGYACRYSPDPRLPIRWWT